MASRIALSKSAPTPGREAPATGFASVASRLADWSGWTHRLLALDGTDRWHDSCVDAFHQLRLPLLTSEAVLTELFHLLGDMRSEMEAAWRFVRSGALVLGTIEHAELQHGNTVSPHSCISAHSD
jgi:hypothetical protein